MTEPARDPWRAVPEPDSPPVPPRYRGVWQRTLLKTADSVDDSSWVRWMQLGRWHADLRVPHAARLGAFSPDGGPKTPMPVQLALQQGFAGVTQVQVGDGSEVCTWHRLVDYQPPSIQPDTGHMVFEGAERVIETGVHGTYGEVWQRIEGSTGRYIALAESAPAAGQVPARLFMVGRYLMRVRPCAHVWQPEFEISFGELRDDRWRIERSTCPALEGHEVGWQLQRNGPALAELLLDDVPTCWRILEWEDGL